MDIEEKSKQQLLISSNFINEINKNSPQDKHIKIILFLYSTFSQKSIDLIKTLPEECKRLFYFLCVDNKKIRQSILLSKKVKIEEIPSIIIVGKDNTVSLYEGENLVEIIKTLYSMISQVIKNNQHQQIQQNQMKMQSQKNNQPKVSKISDILDDDEEDVREEINNRKKVRQSNFSQGLSSARNLPPKGLGHAKMATSSLNRVEDNNIEEEDNDDLEINDGELLGEDLDTFEDESIDPVITKNINNKGIKTDKKETMDSVKRAAMEMQKMRESDL